MTDRQLIELAETAEKRILGWIDEGLVPADPAHGVCDIVVLLRDRVRGYERDRKQFERRERPR